MSFVLTPSSSHAFQIQSYPLSRSHLLFVKLMEAEFSVLVFFSPKLNMCPRSGSCKSCVRTLDHKLDCASHLMLAKSIYFGSFYFHCRNISHSTQRIKLTLFHCSILFRIFRGLKARVVFYQLGTKCAFQRMKNGGGGLC